MRSVKNIIFDLGGVLLNVDYNKTADAFKALGAHRFDEFYSQATANHLFESLETGDISEAAFYEAIYQYCNPATNTEQIKNAWNAILLDFRKESLDTLDRLKDKYNLYLLSNTNSIHHTKFNEILKAETGHQSLDDFFVKSYYSHLIHKRKPYVATYEWVLQDDNMLAAETLFIDDSINNIKGAIEAGINTHHLLPGEKINDLML